MIQVGVYKMWTFAVIVALLTAVINAMPMQRGGVDGVTSDEVNSLAAQFVNVVDSPNVEPLESRAGNDDKPIVSFVIENPKALNLLLSLRYASE